MTPVIGPHSGENDTALSRYRDDRNKSEFDLKQESSCFVVVGFSSGPPFICPCEPEVSGVKDPRRATMIVEVKGHGDLTSPPDSSEGDISGNATNRVLDIWTQGWTDFPNLDGRRSKVNRSSPT